MPQMQAEQQPPFADFMGMKVTLVSPERVVAELMVRETVILPVSHRGLRSGRRAPDTVPGTYSTGPC
jgi:acyl-coenzyme A thioesterase PaaI-like protein